MRHLDLFSGIGGFALGLQWAGSFDTIGFCEVDKAAQKVLKKHWPNVPIYNDVKTLKGSDVGTVDIITGGFPCQDISVAGKGAGLAGERSGLWFEFHRLIKETQPKWVIAENVSALRSRGLDQVLRSLAEIGYDAEWHCIPASAVGAPHRRDRIWIVAYPNGSMEADGRQCQVSSKESNERGTRSSGSCSDDRQGCIRGTRQGSKDDVAYPNNNGQHGSENSKSNCSGDDGSKAWEDISSQSQRPSDLGKDFRGSSSEVVAYSHEFGTQVPVEGQQPAKQMLRGSSENWKTSIGSFWSAEPNVGRVAHGVSGRVDRLKQLGNAVVPQIVQLLGQAILQKEAENGWN